MANLLAAGLYKKLNNSASFLRKQFCYNASVIYLLIEFLNELIYAILKAHLFNAMHGQSAAALTLDNVSGLFGKLISFVIRLAAHYFGIAMAMWHLLAGPVALLIGRSKQSDVLNTMTLSIYIHIPFCKHRCAYCDFNTYANQESLIPDYVSALIKEMEIVGRIAAEQHPETNIHTVFFGGGTPSLLSPKQFDLILKSLRRSFAFTSDIEITIEANPGTVNLEQLKQLRAAGINRISYGVQSANAEELRMLERAHNFFDVIQAVSDSRKAGFDNLNLDLIYGLPEQNLESWKTTLSRVIDLHPEHISAYALTLEHGTPFGRWSSRGLIPIPDPDLAAEMYEYAEDFLASSGYAHYEISNWAKVKEEGGRMRGKENSSFTRSVHPSSFVCRHNLQYWRSLPYLAFGAGAHGYANGHRYSNILRIKTYIERLASVQLPTSYKFPLTPATVNHHKQTLQDDISDYMINNLRLTEIGVSDADFRFRFGRGLTEVFPKEIEELIRNGLLEYVKTSEVYRLTKRGRLLGNQVFVRFV